MIWRNNGELIFMSALTDHNLHRNFFFRIFNKNMVLFLKEVERSENGQDCTEKFKSLISGIDRLVSACLERRVTKHI